MKKYLLSFAVLTSALFFTGCEKDNGRNVITIPISTGAMVVCGGNVGGNIPSSLTYIDYKTGVSLPRISFMPTTTVNWDRRPTMP